MKVVYEGALFPGIGGGPRHFIGISDALVREGVTLVQVLPRTSAVVGDGVPASTVRLPSPGGRILRHLTYEASRAGLVLWWWISGRRVDVWLSRATLFGVGLRLTRLVAHRVLLEVNGPIREEIESNTGSRQAAAIADRLMQAQVAAADLVVAVSPGLARYTAARGRGTPCTVVANGADPALASSPRAPNDGPPRLLFVGALAPWYELDVAFEALRVLREDGVDLPLLVLGDGVRRESLAAQAAESGVADLVEFAGWVDPAAVNAAMTAACVGLLPLCPKHEEVEAVASPLKLYEYVAAGMRVVGTDVDGIANASVATAVHTYRHGDPVSCAAAILAAVDSRGAPRLDEELWSWTARAHELLAQVSALDDVAEAS